MYVYNTRHVHRRVLCLLTKIAFNGASIQRNHLSRFKKTVAYLPRAYTRAYTRAVSFILRMLHRFHARVQYLFIGVTMFLNIRESPPFHFAMISVCIDMFLSCCTHVDLSSTKLGLDSADFSSSRENRRGCRWDHRLRLNDDAKFLKSRLFDVNRVVNKHTFCQHCN